MLLRPHESRSADVLTALSVGMLLVFAGCQRRTTDPVAQSPREAAPQGKQSPPAPAQASDGSHAGPNSPTSDPADRFASALQEIDAASKELNSPSKEAAAHAEKLALLKEMGREIAEARPGRTLWLAVLMQINHAIEDSSVALDSVESQRYEDLAEWRDELPAESQRELRDCTDCGSISGPGWRLTCAVSCAVEAGEVTGDRDVPPPIQLLLKNLRASGDASRLISHATITGRIATKADVVAYLLECVVRDREEDAANDEDLPDNQPVIHRKQAGQAGADG